MGYQLEGDLLEVCDCKVLCPCWIGEDPDNGTCDTILAYKMKKGTINGTDVTGLSIALMAHIPGNILKGNWRVAVFVDDRASKEQEDALLWRVDRKARRTRGRSREVRRRSGRGTTGAHHVHVERGQWDAQGRHRGRLRD